MSLCPFLGLPERYECVNYCDYVAWAFVHLFELFNRSLVDATAFVDEMAGRGRLSGVDVTDDDNVDVNFFLSHVSMSISRP